MAIYRSDQATVTFAPEAGQGGYMESGDDDATAPTFISSGLGIATAVVPGDRSVTLTGTFAPSSGANLTTFIIIGNNTTLSGPKEMRRVVSGYNSSTVTVDTPWGFPHPVISAGANLVESFNTAADGTIDAVQTDDKGKFITWFPGVYESVDCPDPEQAFEPRYVLGGLTKRNFYQMYAGNETLTGSMGGMVMLNGFPLRFPIGRIVTTPVVITNNSHSNADHDQWKLDGAAKAGDTFIAVDQAAGTFSIPVGTYLLFGVPAGKTAPTGAVHDQAGANGIHSGTTYGFAAGDKVVYEIRQVVTASASVGIGVNATVQIWPPLTYDHSDNDDLYQIAVTTSTEFLHSIYEEVALTPLTWNVNIPDDAGTNVWQRRYVGGKVGSLTLSAESGGLLTGGWDGVNFLDMVHNMKAHPDLPANQPMPRYTSMQSITSTKVGKYNSSGTFDRPATAPYYYSQGIIKMFGDGHPHTNSATTESELARIASFSLSISNSTEPKYYVGAQYDGRRAPKEQYEGNREYSMSASIGTNNSANQGTDDTRNLFKELLLAGDYRGTTAAAGFRGFGIQLKFIRDLDGSSNDYILIDIPGDGTAAAGGNEQGAFIRAAPHNIGDDSPILADADIVFRDMRIKIRDTEPIYP